MDETYGTYVDDECFGIHDYDDDTDLVLMIILMMILMKIQMMILMMILMVGAGTEDWSWEESYTSPRMILYDETSINRFISKLMIS